MKINKLNESAQLKEELWDSARVTDLVRYYLDRNDVPTNTLANLIRKQMEEEGSKLPFNVTDFYDVLYMAVNEYNGQFEDNLDESKSMNEAVISNNNEILTLWDEFTDRYNDIVWVLNDIETSKAKQYVRELQAKYRELKEVCNKGNVEEVKEVKSEADYLLRICEMMITYSKSIKEHFNDYDTFTQHAIEFYCDSHAAEYEADKYCPDNPDSWDISDSRFVPRAVEYYKQSEYYDPEDWCHVNESRSIKIFGAKGKKLNEAVNAMILKANDFLDSVKKRYNINVMWSRQTSNGDGYILRFSFDKDVDPAVFDELRAEAKAIDSRIKVGRNKIDNTPEHYRENTGGWMDFTFPLYGYGIIESGQTLSEEVKDSSFVQYEFPPFTEADRRWARYYGLQIDDENEEGSFVSGSMKDIKSFCDEYLGYELVDEYLTVLEEGIFNDIKNVAKSVGSEIKKSKAYQHAVKPIVDRVMNSDAYKNISSTVKDTDTYKKVKSGIDRVKTNLPNKNRKAADQKFLVKGSYYSMADLQYKDEDGKKVTPDQFAQMSGMQKKKCKVTVPRSAKPITESFPIKNAVIDLKSIGSELFSRFQPEVLGEKDWIEFDMNEPHQYEDHAVAGFTAIGETKTLKGRFDARGNVVDVSIMNGSEGKFTSVDEIERFFLDQFGVAQQEVIQEGIIDDATAATRYLDIEIPEMCADLLNIIPNMKDTDLSMLAECCRKFYAVQESIATKYGSEVPERHKDERVNESLKEEYSDEEFKNVSVALNVEAPVEYSESDIEVAITQALDMSPIRVKMDGFYFPSLWIRNTIEESLKEEYTEDTDDRLKEINEEIFGGKHTVKIGDTLTSKSGHKIHIDDMSATLTPFENNAVVTFYYSFEMTDGTNGSSHCSTHDLKNMLQEDVEVPTLEGPPEGPESGIASMLNEAIQDELKTIQMYNDTALAARSEGFEDIAAQIDEINTEENKHVGQLQEILKTVAPNASAITAGELEASDDLVAVEESVKDEQLTEDKQRWEEIYDSFKTVEKELNGDGEAITATIDKLYDDNRSDPDYKKAYDKWASNE